MKPAHSTTNQNKCEIEGDAAWTFFSGYVTKGLATAEITRDDGRQCKICGPRSGNLNKPFKVT